MRHNDDRSVYGAKSDKGIRTRCHVVVAVISALDGRPGNPPAQSFHNTNSNRSPPEAPMTIACQYTAELTSKLGDSTLKLAQVDMGVEYLIKIP